MEAKNRHPNPRSANASPTPAALDAMSVRSAAEVVGILRSTEPKPERGHPIGMWKTGWLAQAEGAA